MPAVTETALIKSPYSSTVYTDEQIKEFALCADPVDGPIYFMDHFF